MCIYAPTTNDPTSVATKFMELVEAEAEKAHDENKEVIIAGDFNAKIGRRRESDEGIHFGSEGLDETNKRGKMWREFAIRNNFFVCDTYFKAKKSKKIPKRNFLQQTGGQGFRRKMDKKRLLPRI